MRQVRCRKPLLWPDGSVMNNWVGLTVAEILALCATDFAEVSMIDEPPGKLRAIEFPVMPSRAAARSWWNSITTPVCFHRRGRGRRRLSKAER